jgi:uptake hydrogenase large subunit
VSRVVVGPFNRVEGDLEVSLEIEDGRVREARVTVPLYRGFEQILVGRPVDDALVIAPRICGICSVSQSLAASAVIAAFSGVTAAPNGALAAALAHGAENVADHLSHFYLFFMPDFARDDYAGAAWHGAVEPRFRAVRGTAGNDFLKVRARLLEIMGLVAGKWPHSLAFRPGGTTRALDLGEKTRARGILADVRRFAEGPLFGARLEEIAVLEGLDDLERLEGRGGSDFATFLRLARAIDLWPLGPGPGTVMSFGAYPGVGPEARALFAPGVVEVASGHRSTLDVERIVEDPARAWLVGEAAAPARGTTAPDMDRPDAYSWAKAPRYDGRTVEVGALARQIVDGTALARALVAGGTTGVAARVVARLVEVARVLLAMERWVGGFERGAPFCVEGGMPTDGSGVGLVEAARGSLGHWMTVRGGRITRYQIVAPTTWNFSPRDGAGVPGPLERALEGLDVGALGARAPAIQHVVRSFDPCMVCTAH